MRGYDAWKTRSDLDEEDMRRSPRRRRRSARSTDPELADALEADAEKLKRLGADPGPTLADLEEGELQ